MGYARIRPELQQQGRPSPWVATGVELRDLEGNELYWTPEAEWVKVVAFDAMATGLYVLTDDDDYYFTCHSANLEYSDTLPSPLYPRAQLFQTMQTTPTKQTKERPMGKHALPYNPHRDTLQADFNALVEQLGQDLDTWQLIARDLARDILRGYADTNNSREYALDVINRLSHMPEMNIHPSERSL